MVGKLAPAVLHVYVFDQDVEHLGAFSGGQGRSDVMERLGTMEALGASRLDQVAEELKKLDVKGGMKMTNEICN